MNYCFCASPHCHSTRNRVHLCSRLILSVASKRVHVRKKRVLIGCKSDMFWRQTFKVWSRRLLSTWFVFAQQNQSLQDFQTLRIIFGGKCAVSEREMWLKVVKNEIWVERVDQKEINNLPLAWQFALMAVKIQMFGDKTRHVWHPITTCFFCLMSTLRCKRQYNAQQCSTCWMVLWMLCDIMEVGLFNDCWTGAP